MEKKCTLDTNCIPRPSLFEKNEKPGSWIFASIIIVHCNTSVPIQNTCLFFVENLERRIENPREIIINQWMINLIGEVILKISELGNEIMQSR